MRRILIAAALLIVPAVLPFASSVVTEGTLLGGDVLVEDFEGYDVVALPEPEGGEYTAASSGQGSFFVVNSTSVSGEQSVKMSNSGTAGFGAGFGDWGADLCDGGVVEFKLRIDTALGSDQWIVATTDVGKARGQNDNQVGFVVETDGDVMAVVTTNGNAASQVDMGFNWVAEQWMTLRIQDVDCGAAKASFVSVENQIVETIDRTGSVDSGLDTLAAGTDSSDDFEFFFDDVKWPKPVASTPITVASWCPDPGLFDFGYNYRTGVTFGTSPDFDLDDAYVFEGDANDEAWAIKVWDHDTHHMNVHLTLEARVEGTSSEFMVFFLTEDPTPFLTGETLDSSATGNGETGGLLDNTRIAFFKEVDNNWRISFRQNIGGEVTFIGQSWLGGSANKPTPFILENQMDGQTGDAMRAFNKDGTLLLQTDGVSNFGLDPITGIAIMGQSGGFGDAETALNDNDGAHNSSCYFFQDIEQDQTNFTGSEGALPNNPDADAPPEDEPPPGAGGSGAFSTGSTGEALGLPDEAMGWFFGIIFTVMVTFGLAQIHPVLIVPGVAVGIGGAVAFSYLPLWLPVFIVLLAAAVIVLRMKGGGG